MRAATRPGKRGAALADPSRPAIVLLDKVDMLLDGVCCESMRYHFVLDYWTVR